MKEELKDIKFEMANNLSPKIREQFELNDYEGLVAIETISPNLRIKIEKVEDLKKYYLSKERFQKTK